LVAPIISIRCHYLLCGQKVTQKPPAGIKWLNLRCVSLNKINAPQPQEPNSSLVSGMILFLTLHSAVVLNAILSIGRISFFLSKESISKSKLLFLNKSDQKICLKRSLEPCSLYKIKEWNLCQPKFRLAPRSTQHSKLKRSIIS